MGWKLAKSLVKLREELDDLFPDRDKARDGSIGDAKHRARRSDHNPNEDGYVTAIDVDEHSDESVGRFLWDHIVKTKPSRVKYAIYEGKMVSSYPARGHDAWEVRDYHGSNKHRGHIHISVVSDKRKYNSSRSWGLSKASKAKTKPAPKRERASSEGFDVASLATVKKGDRNENVKVLQHLLGLYGSPTRPDGIFGPDTERQVKQVQAKLGVTGDGIVGPKTWGALLRAR